jgi:hypothetical protein
MYKNHNQLNFQNLNYHEKRWPLWSIENIFQKGLHIWTERFTFHDVPSLF